MSTATTLFDQPKTEAPMFNTDNIELPPEPQGYIVPVEHRATTPMDLLQMAVDKSFDPERLRALMDLQREWQKDRAEEAFSAAMHACQEEMPVVVRDAANKQTNSRFAKLENIQIKCRPIYSKHGFSLSYGEDDCPTPSYKRTVCDVRHADGACHRYHLDLPIDGVGAKGNAIGGMNPVQGCISTTSYGQRRLLCMIFNITIADEDDDGQSAEKVNDKQIVILNEWIETTGAKLDPFLKFMDVDSLADIPAQDFDKAVAALKQVGERRKQQGK